MSSFISLFPFSWVSDKLINEKWSELIDHVIKMIDSPEVSNAGYRYLVLMSTEH